MSGLHHKSTTSWSARSNFLPQQGGKVLGTEPGMSRSRAPSSTQKTCVAAPLSHSLRNGDAENSKYASPSQDKMAADARSAATIPGFQGAWPGGGIPRRDIAAVEALFHCTSSRSLEPATQDPSWPLPCNSRALTGTFHKFGARRVSITVR
jgi:hypothetical protein